MGLSVVLSCDEAGGFFPSDVLALLVEAAARRTPVSVSPWQVSAPMHSSSLVVLSVGGARLEPADGASCDSGVWAKTRSVGARARATKELLRSPASARRAAAMFDGGASEVSVLFGDRPLPVPGAGSSVWWVYLDALDGMVAAGPDRVAQVFSELRASGVQSGAVGSFVNAVNFAGVVSGGEVALVWSSNRLCRSDELTAAEACRLPHHMLPPGFQA